MQASVLAAAARGGAHASAWRRLDFRRTTPATSPPCGDWRECQFGGPIADPAGGHGDGSRRLDQLSQLRRPNLSLHRRHFVPDLCRTLHRGTHDALSAKVPWGIPGIGRGVQWIWSAVWCARRGVCPASHCHRSVRCDHCPGCRHSRPAPRCRARKSRCGSALGSRSAA